MFDGGHGSDMARGNIRAGNKFYLAGAHDEQLAEFDPMTETYQVINWVRIVFKGNMRTGLQRPNKIKLFLD